LQDIHEEYKRIGKIEDDNNKISKDKSLPSLQTIVKSIHDKFGENSKENLLLSIFIELPKRDDYYLKIIANKTGIIDANTNYIIVPKNKTKPIQLYIQAYKTSGKYDAQYENISIKLSADIRKYIDINNLKYNDYIFKNDKIQPDIKRMFRDEFPIINGVNALRHIVVSHYLNNPDFTTNDSLKLAKTMNHSTKTQSSYNRVIQ
jgi:hypothetical protein